MKHLGIIIVGILAILAMGCSTGGSMTQFDEQEPLTTAAEADLPLDTELETLLPTPEHSASGIFANTVLGGNWWAKSDNAQQINDTVRLSPGPAEMSWAMYRLDSDFVDQLDYVMFDVIASDGDDAYVAMYNNIEERWNIAGPFAGALDSIEIDKNGYEDEFGSVFIAIISYDEDSVSISSISLEAEAAAAVE